MSFELPEDAIIYIAAAALAFVLFLAVTILFKGGTQNNIELLLGIIR